MTNKQDLLSEVIKPKVVKKVAKPTTSSRAAKAIEEGDPQKAIDQLSPKQLRFVEEYVKDRNGSAAVIRAGYDTVHPEKMAYQLKQHAAIKLAIETYTAELRPIGINTDFVLEKLVSIAAKADAENNHNAALRAYELIAKHLGMFIERKEISGPDGDAIELRKTQEAADSFTRTVLALAGDDDK